MISGDSKWQKVNHKTLASTEPVSRPQAVMGESQKAFKEL